MDNLIKNKIEEKQNSNKQDKKILERLAELEKALASYNKNIINKTFFEKYFTRTNEKGEVIKDWKGNIATDFNFSDKQWSFSNYKKRIFLAHSEYIELKETDRESILQAVKEKTETVNNWIIQREQDIKEYENIDQSQIVKDLQAIYRKHNSPSLWTEILNLYKVKYPNE